MLAFTIDIHYCVGHSKYIIWLFDSNLVLCTKLYPVSKRLITLRVENDLFIFTLCLQTRHKSVELEVLRGICTAIVLWSELLFLIHFCEQSIGFVLLILLLLREFFGCNLFIWNLLGITHFAEGCFLSAAGHYGLTQSMKMRICIVQLNKHPSNMVCN